MFLHNKKKLQDYQQVPNYIFSNIFLFNKKTKLIIEKSKFLKKKVNSMKMLLLREKPRWAEWNRRADTM